MSASDNSNANLFRWKIVDMCHQRSSAGNDGLTSKTFSSQNYLSVQFVVFIQFEGFMRYQNDVRVILKQIDDKPVEASVKLWVESVGGHKFGETFVKKHVFGKVGDFCGFKGISGKERKEFESLYFSYETFFVCCEIVVLNLPAKFSIIHCEQDFLQNHWTLYEKEFHDSVVKIGKTEFKVLKMFFVAQSTVFEQIFTSNFKEGRTGTIEIKDIEENTMKHLIKWLYTNKLQCDAPIEKLFYAADKYDIKILKTACTQLIIDSLSEKNAFSRLVLASVHSNNKLKSAALEFISKLSKLDLTDVLMSDEWVELKIKNSATAKEVKELIRNKLK